MLGKLRRAILLVVLLVGLFGSGPTVLAATYGSGVYGACAYQTGCPADSTGAPNTGLEQVALLWTLIAGVVGLMVIGFVTVRYLNSDKRRQQ